ncbi:hypothetical protein BU15DRAFT_81911 [Melanogaster broomeanus]|nr:hypothetical protein BU15DRAFT_81911 [Melanogaster broomeanus]
MSAQEDSDALIMSIEELEALDFRHKASADLIRQHAAEKECNRKAGQHVKPDTIKCMQFTFSLDHLSPVAANAAVSKPDLKPSAALSPHAGVQPLATRLRVAPATLTSRRRLPLDPGSARTLARLTSNRFSALPLQHHELCVTNTSSRGFSIIRPTIELPLDELLSNTGIDATEDNLGRHHARNLPIRYPSSISIRQGRLPQTIALAKVSPSASTWGNTPNGRLNLMVKTHNAPTTHSSGPGATATSVNPAVLRGNLQEAFQAEIEVLRAESENSELCDNESPITSFHSGLSATQAQLTKYHEEGAKREEREVAELTAAVSTLKKKLESYANYDEIKRELEIMKYVEFGGLDDDASDADVDDWSSHDSEAAWMAKSLEVLLASKNKRILEELTRFQILHRSLEESLRSISGTKAVHDKDDVPAAAAAQPVSRWTSCIHTTHDANDADSTRQGPQRAQIEGEKTPRTQEVNGMCRDEQSEGE